MTEEGMLCAYEAQGPRGILPGRVWNAYAWFRTEWLMRPHLSEFQAFYEGLEHRRAIFYVFFTSRLLHWMIRTVELVPSDVNVVLFGSGLNPEEVSWIRQNVPRPFHHIRERVDDKTAWEMLFRVNRESFGWLDVDCMVTQPRLFREMSELPEDAGINCIWSYRGVGGRSILCTHLLFINHAPIRELRRRGVEVSPCTYNYDGSAFGRDEGLLEGRLRKYAVSRIPTKAQLRLLEGRQPLDNLGRPAYPSLVAGYPCFDTLVMFQLLAEAVGYRLNRVRDLDGLYDGSPDRYFADHDFSELIHPGGVSWYRQMKNDVEAQERYQNLLKAEYCLLQPLNRRLPPFYQGLLEELEAELEECGVSPAQARADIEEYLLSKGAPRESFARMFGG